MVKWFVRSVASGIAVTAVALGFAAGPAAAEGSAPRTSVNTAETPVWLAPGVDIGTVADPLLQTPTAALQPVVGTLTLLNG